MTTHPYNQSKLSQVTAAYDNAVSFQVRITRDPRVHLPSTWKDARGKVLTDRRISVLRKQGWFGSGVVMPATNTSAHPCLGCGTRTQTRHYLHPYAGYYCAACRKVERDAALLDARIRKDRERQQLAAYEE